MEKKFKKIRQNILIDLKKLILITEINNADNQLIVCKSLPLQTINRLSVVKKWKSKMTEASEPDPSDIAIENLYPALLSCFAIITVG